MRQDDTAKPRPHIDVTRLGFSEPPPCWALIEPDQTVSRHVEVLVPNEATIYTVDSLESVDQVSHEKTLVLLIRANRTPVPLPSDCLGVPSLASQYLQTANGWHC